MIEHCPHHRGNRWVTCGPCRADALATGPDALAEYNARRNSDDGDHRLPVRYRRATASTPEVVEWLQEWRRDPATSPSLLLKGPVGVGKTWQAYGALRDILHARPATTWMATSSVDMYANLRPHPNIDSAAVMEQYQRARVLLIDDLGTAKLSEWVEEVTYRILGARYDAMLTTIYTTNVPDDALADYLGDRVASRLVETCRSVVLTGVDRRRVAAVPA